MDGGRGEGNGGLVHMKDCADFKHDFLFHALASREYFLHKKCIKKEEKSTKLSAYERPFSMVPLQRIAFPYHLSVAQSFPSRIPFPILSPNMSPFSSTIIPIRLFTDYRQEHADKFL